MRRVPPVAVRWELGIDAGRRGATAHRSDQVGSTQVPGDEDALETRRRSTPGDMNSERGTTYESAKNLLRYLSIGWLMNWVKVQLDSH